MFESALSSLEVIISTFGAPGIFLAMFIETIFPPIPSEIVMPLGGYIAYVGGLGWPGLVYMILAGTAGSTAGAVVIYYVAKIGGRAMVLRYGKRFFLDKKKLAMAEKWFSKHGGHAVFLCRMAPGLREIISIPAGLAKMNFPKFLLLTFAGSLVWSSFLGTIGFVWAESWRTFGLSGFLNVLALVLILSVIVYIVYKRESFIELFVRGK